MGGTFTLFPTQASTMAGRVDNLYFFMLAVTLFFSVLVAALVVTLAVKYRRRKADDVGANIHGSTALEVIWTAIPLLIAMVMFVWGTSVYFALAKPPAEAMEVYIVGKRWMWKAQHLTGHREINQLHVPVGTPVKLLISSEDVIHSLLHPGVPPEDRRRARQDHDDVVRGDQGGHLPAVLRGVLRHAALGDDRQGRRDGAA